MNDPPSKLARIARVTMSRLLLVVLVFTLTPQGKFAIILATQLAWMLSGSLILALWF